MLYFIVCGLAESGIAMKALPQNAVEIRQLWLCLTLLSCRIKCMDALT